jgi:hypothetical protein
MAFSRFWRVDKLKERKKLIESGKKCYFVLNE